MGVRGDKVLMIENIGSVKFRISQRAKRLNIRIKPNHGVLVTVPFGMSMKQAASVVKSKSDWITRNLKKVKAYEASAIIYDGTQQIGTRYRRLQVEACNLASPEVLLSADEIVVRYPRSLQLTDPDVQTVIQFGLTEGYRLEAKRYLPQRVAELAKVHGFSYNRVFVKNHRSRWGSCSEVNNINLNLHLLQLSDEIIDYVILHELVHTEIKNHSAAFWQRVEQVCPNVKDLRRQLRNHRIPILA